MLYHNFQLDVLVQNWQIKLLSKFVRLDNLQSLCVMQRNIEFEEFCITVRIPQNKIFKTGMQLQDVYE